VEGGESKDAAEGAGAVAGWTRIEGSEGRWTHELLVDDIGCLVKAVYIRRTELAADGGRAAADEALGALGTATFGAVEAGMPGALVSVTGECQVGKVLLAEAEYTGGHEGASEYWWVRLKDGDRATVRDIQGISPAISLQVSDGERAGESRGGGGESRGRAGGGGERCALSSPLGGGKELILVTCYGSVCIGVYTAALQGCVRVV
jgi:hypothetical protein